MGEDGAGPPAFRGARARLSGPAPSGARWQVGPGPARKTPKGPPKHTQHKDKCFWVVGKSPTPLRLVIKIMSISQE
jgi:hypothetical protein